MRKNKSTESFKAKLLAVQSEMAKPRVVESARGLTHYHIRWSGRTALDWECFNTHAEAAASAKQLVRQGEMYTIEEHGEACSRCCDAMKLKHAHGTSKEANV